ncbi:MAG: GNAT family N-acetyltransferase [Tannerellaceae bacterium]|nr:GNAT family N-acetyltransferase [Tannerellaceae bacterium]
MAHMKAIIRKWKPEDAESLAKYANNPNIARFLTDGFPHPYTIEDAHAYIKIAMQQDPATLMAISLDGEAIGSIGLVPQTDVHAKNMEIGYFLAEPFWGQGIATSAIKQMVEYAFQTFDITRIFARPFGHNTASQRVLQKAGFTREAHFKNTIYKQGTFHDEIYYGIYK